MIEKTNEAIDLALADFFCQKLVLPDIDRYRVAFIIQSLSEKMRLGHSCILISSADALLFFQMDLASDGEIIRPFVVDQNYLYFYRYWQYEQNIAKIICQKIMINNVEISDQHLEVIDQLFADPFNGNINETNWQRVAVENALKQHFSMITGGPGTGKTTTVIKLLVALITLKKDNNITIAVAAPTGKAASRLQESIAQNKQKLPNQLLGLANGIPEQVTTIHQLLKPKYLSPFFKYNQNNKLPYDIIVIDEASMVDVPLMAKLLQALKATARLILLGDQFQLSSVEVGSLLADLTFALPEYTNELKKTYRFDGPIKDLAVAVNQQQFQLALGFLKNDTQVVQLYQDKTTAYQVIGQYYENYIEQVINAKSVQVAFQCFNQFQVLCANNVGPNGIEEVNWFIEKKLESQNMIDRPGFWYAGKPVMIQENTYYANMQLSNGDIGICLADKNGRLLVYFEDMKGSYVGYVPSKLPKSQTAYALSIHKSQGSEFEHVMIVLPEKLNTIMTKELLYTAITRAKKSVKIVATEAILKHMVQQKVQRTGGIIRMLKRLQENKD